jgi:signal peptidase II
VRKKLSITFGIVILLLILDQAIKLWVKKTFNYGESIEIFSWFSLEYIENQGMAFGTKFGVKPWAKLSLSIFRIIAIIAIIIYMYRLSRKNIRTEGLIAVGFVLAGAMGNLIDSMFYDFIFDFNPSLQQNWAPGSGIPGPYGEIRAHGFLYGNVVDMFIFTSNWPEWVPWVGGSEVFPAIWNIADGTIFCGIVWIILRSKRFFIPISIQESTVPYGNDNLSKTTTEENDKSSESTPEQD